MGTISSYTAATGVTDDDVFLGNDGTVTKKFPATVVRTYMQAGLSGGGASGLNGVIDVTQSPYFVVADSNGTTGNGTDNRTAINTAYTDACNQHKALYFPPAVNWYRWTSFLNFTSAGGPLVLFGGGRDKTKLFADGTTTCGIQCTSQLSVDFHSFTLRKYKSGTRMGPPTAIVMDYCDSVVVDNVEIDGGDSASIVFWTCTKVLVTNCFVHGAIDGIHFEDSKDIAAIGNVCWNNTDDAIACVNNAGGVANERMVIMGNSIKDCDARGIFIAGANGVVVGNHVDNTAGQGIYVEAASNWRSSNGIIISENTITNAGRKSGGVHGYGICVTRADATQTIDNILISNNIIKTPLYMFMRIGFWDLVQPIKNVQVINNMCIGPVANVGLGANRTVDPAFYPGISLENIVDGVIADNYIERPYAAGINSFGNASDGLMVVRNNVIVRPNAGAVGSPWNRGITLDSAIDAVVTGNVTRDPASAVSGNNVVIAVAVNTLSNTANIYSATGPA